jgi:phosphopantetheinyl transferase (holo-ACP synthase)
VSADGSRVVVGNDVVDMLDPRLRGKPEDARFVERVLSPSERHLLDASADPDLELWCLWAAKEAAYKAVSKLRAEPPVFSHAAFVVDWAASSAPPIPAARVRSGVVRFEEALTHVVVTRSSGALHALAHLSPTPQAPPDLGWGVESLMSPGAPWHGTLPELMARLSEREQGAVHSLESAAVRIAARAALASAMHLDEPRLEIVCDPGPYGRRPPRVCLDGVPAAADVSLSHAGRWIAWTYWVDPNADPRAALSPPAAGS